MSAATPTRDECIAAAGEVYGSILADPIRAAQIRAHMAEHDGPQTAARNESGGDAGQRNTTRKSA